MAPKLNFIVQAGQLVLDATQETFSPRLGATAKEIRINGAICVGVGFLCIAICGIVVLLAGPYSSSKILLLPSMMAYACFIVGGYRLVFGKSAEAKTDEVFNWRRVLFATGWVLFVLGLPVMLLTFFIS